MALSDEELVNDILKGNQSAMEVLVNRNYKFIYAFIYRNIGEYNTALDLTQESYIKIMKNLKSFKKHKGNFQCWILKIALNVCKDYWKSAYVKYNAGDDGSLEKVYDEENVINYLEKVEQRQEIKNSIMLLPEEQREVIILRYYNDLKIRDIANISGTKESTGKSRLRLAIEKLKILLQGRDNSEKTREVFNDAEFLDISQEEMKQFIDTFSDYSIQYPAESEIDQCVENLRVYVPKNKNLAQGFEKFLRRGQIEISYINKLYWIISIVIFLITFKLAISMNIDPYKVIILIGPIPLLLGLVEIFKGKENNMLELELSFKISGKEMVISRIIVIGIFNIILNTAISLVLFKTGLDIQILKINILWIVPFIWINLMAFIIAKKVRGYYVSLGAISLWVLLLYELFQNRNFMEKIIYINIGVYIALAISGIYLFYRVLKKYMKTEIKDFIYEE
ncbi:RNA polymerase sigma factor [Clostridium sp. Marseille-Q2269]|uniref:RNA polymerase sigma factor n=1 Tax=Clostridium sp. Marseille-Q2269 TaxID=2942205 RepID=UPI00207304B8|nr:RNA polymerase sigma factor [Clostridium sp. Marseille-Q2269]